MALSPRDRTALTIGGLVLLIFVLVQFVLFPLLDKRKRLERTVTLRQQHLAEMQTMQQRYSRLHAQSSGLAQQLSSRVKGFSLFSFLEQMASKARVKEHIAYMKPSTMTGEGPLQQVMVEIKLQTLGLAQLVRFLELIESPENVVEIKRISIQENSKSKGTLDVILQVISILPEKNDRLASARAERKRP